MALYARPSLSGWEQGDDASAFSRPSLSTWEQFQPSGGGGPVPITFTGTVPTLTGTVGVSFSQGLSSYFSGTLTPFTYSLQAGTLPAGLTLNSSTGVISGTPTTAGTSTGIVIRGTDSAANTADTNAFSITIASSTVPITFGGTVPTLTFTVGSSGSVNLATYFSGTLTPFTFALDGASAALPSGVTLNSAGLLSWSGTGTAGTTAGVIVQGTDTGANSADTNAFNIVIQAASSNVRLSIGVDWDRGAEFASQTINRWAVFSLDGATMLHTGTGLTSSTGGVFTININAAAFNVGDTRRFLLWQETGETAVADRTVTVIAGYVTATAQV